jgi:hypothetical protein
VPWPLTPSPYSFVHQVFLEAKLIRYIWGRRILHFARQVWRASPSEQHKLNHHLLHSFILKSLVWMIGWPQILQGYIQNERHDLWIGSQLNLATDGICWQNEHLTTQHVSIPLTRCTMDCSVSIRGTWLIGMSPCWRWRATTTRTPHDLTSILTYANRLILRSSPAPRIEETT